MAQLIPEAHNTHYHNTTDIPSNLNMDFLESVIKMVLAFILIESHYKNKYSFWKNNLYFFLF